MRLPGLRNPRSPADMLRASDVVAVRPGITVEEVHAYARAWSPDARRTDDGHLLVPPYLQIVGPVAYDEALWRRAAMPDTAAAAYAVTDQPRGGPVVMELTSGDLASGLARRLGGWFRISGADRWYAGADTPREPRLYAERALAPQTVVQVLATYVAGLHLEVQDEDGYRLESDRISVIVETDVSAEPYPLISRQPWFESWESTAVYAVEADRDADRVLAAEAARVLRDATGGVLLDDDGFAWDTAEPPG